MSENKNQKREEIGRAIEESDWDAEGAAERPGGVAGYIREEWGQISSSDGVMNYVLSALDFITCGKCNTTYVKGDEHDCPP